MSIPTSTTYRNVLFPPLAILAAILPLACASRCKANAERPHIVVFIADDQGYQDSSVSGADEFRTPNLERLAAAGMTFSHAFAASPTCAPSRAALLTGLMPHRNGSMLNHQPPRPDVTKLPDVLRELGYDVAAFGKVAHYRQGKLFGFDQVVLDGFHEDQCITAAADFLKRRSSPKPLCLFVGTNWPHVPWPKRDTSRDLATFNLPPTFVDTPLTRRWRGRYVAAVENADRDLGLIYDAARERLGDNLIFVYLTDQGPQWPFAKWNLYDAGIRANLTIAWPNKIPANSRSDALVSLVDLLPTLIDVVGGSPQRALDGQSFGDILAGRQTAHRNQIFTTHSGDGHWNETPMRSVRTRQWKYIRNLRPGTVFTTHIDQAKAADGRSYWRSWVERATGDPAASAIIDRYHHRPAEELYNLDNDPSEQQNLAGSPQHAARLAELRAELDHWMLQQGDQGLATEEAVAAAFLKPQAADDKPSDHERSTPPDDAQP